MCPPDSENYLVPDSAVRSPHAWTERSQPLQPASENAQLTSGESRRRMIGIEMQNPLFTPNHARANVYVLGSGGRFGSSSTDDDTVATCNVEGALRAIDDEGGSTSSNGRGAGVDLLVDRKLSVASTLLAARAADHIVDDTSQQRREDQPAYEYDSWEPRQSQQRLEEQPAYEYDSWEPTPTGRSSTNSDMPDPGRAYSAMATASDNSNRRTSAKRTDILRPEVHERGVSSSAVDTLPGDQTTHNPGEERQAPRVLQLAWEEEAHPTLALDSQLQMYDNGDAYEPNSTNSGVGVTSTDLGRRVRVYGYTCGGTLRFYGNHSERGMLRCGVELDVPEGKNDGSINVSLARGIEAGAHRYQDYQLILTFPFLIFPCCRATDTFNVSPSMGCWS